MQRMVQNKSIGDYIKSLLHDTAAQDHKHAEIKMQKFKVYIFYLLLK